MKRMITYFSSTVLMTATLLATGCSASGVLSATPPIPQRIPASAQPTIAEAKKTATKQTEDQQDTHLGPWQRTPLPAGSIRRSTRGNKASEFFDC